MTPLPVLETERLILRPPIAEDFDAWAAFASDEVVMLYLGGVQPRAGAWRGFMTIAGSWLINGFSMFSVVEKTSGRWIGRLGPWRPEGWPGTEVAWGLAREAWRKGYATEGAAAAMDWAVGHLGWTELIHTIDPDNLPSQAVAKRLGSRPLRPGKLPPPLDGMPVQVWGQSREDWLGRRR